MAYLELLKKDMDGKFVIVDSIRKYFEIENDSVVIIFKIAKVLEDKFGFAKRSPVVGSDETIIECTKDNMKLLICWDNSLGFYIMVKSKGDKKHIEDAARYMDKVLDDPIFDGYIRVSTSAKSK